MADVEVVIVNDGSDDADTLDILDDLRAAGWWVVDQENQGLAAARNRGFRETHARYVLPLDADNRVSSAYLEKAVEVMDAEPDVGVVYADAEFFGDKDGRWTVGPFDLERLLDGNFIDACAVVRRDAWERAGGYDGGMPVMGFEDWSLWLSFVEDGWRFHYLPEVLFDYRVRGDSMATTCNIPENRGLLYEYVIEHHRTLYDAVYPQMIGRREAAYTSAARERDTLRVKVAEARGVAESASARLAEAYQRLREVHDTAVAAHDALDRVRRERDLAVARVAHLEGLLAAERSARGRELTDDASRSAP